LRPGRARATISEVPLKETLGESEESRRGGAVLAPRLVRVMHYERLEAGGGPAVELGKAPLILGRGDPPGLRSDASTTHLEVDDPMMSRQHARVVTMGAGEYLVEDLGSRNGTWIDGRSVRHERLADGTIFETGRTAWLFRRAPKGAPEHVAIGPTRSYSPRILALVGQVERLAPASVSLLLVGETGTGKEVFARELHARSGRGGKFIAVNCGALTESLLESELFGHARGAFTGAAGDRAGLVEAADHGTLFLDEIGEMPAAVQVRLLRVLQEGEVLPVGATAPRKVDVRVVAATHRDLLQMVEDGAFREDLYARLEGWVLSLPRLADRREDLGELVAHAVRAAGVTHAAATLRAARALLAFDWPFNVRQLLKGIEAALALGGERVAFEHLPERIRAGPRAPSAPPGGASAPPPDDTLDAGDRELRDRVIAALRAHRGNVTHAADALAKQRQQVQRWMRRFGLRAEDYSEP
jgi:sigma-54 dependent transcriptional regulator, acetoin dehydrogenase operon transcriptional activator AcoR